MRWLSVSGAVESAFYNPIIAGTGLGSGYIGFDQFVLALTPPGRSRMPNGVETGMTVELGQRAYLGEGSLRLDGESVTPGPLWDPVPHVRHLPSTAIRLRPDPDRIAGLGPGLTPAGDDILCGYLAGLTLFKGRRRDAAQLAERAAAATTRLSATLLRHAARGELPEPAHTLLEDGDDRPLLTFGHSSGRCILLGLALGASDTGGEAGSLEQFLEASRAQVHLVARCN